MEGGGELAWKIALYILHTYTLYGGGGAAAVVSWYKCSTLNLTRFAKCIILYYIKYINIPLHITTADKTRLIAHSDIIVVAVAGR